MGRKEDMLFLARKRTKSVAEETGKIQVISRESPPVVGNQEPLLAEEVGVPLPEILELHPRRVGLDSRVACPTQVKFCHFAITRNSGCQGCLREKTGERVELWKEEGDRTFVYSVP